jgi:hypothetical protein
MKKEDIEEKLKKLKRKEISDETIKQFQDKFEGTLIHYVKDANARRKQRETKKRRLYFSLGIAAAIIIALIFPLKNYMFKKKVEHIIYSDPHIAYLWDKGMGRPYDFRFYAKKVEIDKKLKVLHIYVNLQRTIILYDLENNKIIGTAEYGLQIPTEKTIVKVTMERAEEAMHVLTNDSFIKRLDVKDITVWENSPIFYINDFNYSNSYVRNIVLADIILKDGRKFTAAVDLNKDRILDITDAPDVRGEFYANKRDILYKVDTHFLLYGADKIP